MERGTRVERPRATPKPDIPPPPVAETKRKGPPPIPEKARRVPPPPSDKAIDVRGATFLAPDSLIPAGERGPEKRTSKPSPPPEQGPAPEAGREQEKQLPAFEAASNVPELRGAGGVDVNPEAGTFVFVAAEGAETPTVEAVVDEASGRLEESGAETRRTDVVSVTHGELMRSRSLSADSALMAASSRAADAAVVVTNAHRLARGERGSRIEVPPYVVGQVITEEITPTELYGDVRETERVIGGLLDKEGGPQAEEKRLTQEVGDAQARFEAARAQVREWLGGRDPLELYPTRTDLEESDLTIEQQDYMRLVFIAEDDLNAARLTFSSAESNLRITKTLEKKMNEMRQRRLTENDEDFEDSYRALANDPELAKFSTDNRRVLLERLKRPIVLNPETSQSFAAPELPAEDAAQVKDAADKLTSFFKKIKNPKSPSERNAALQAAISYFNSSPVQRVVSNPAERLALYQAVAKEYPYDANLDILFRQDVAAVPAENEKAERLAEPVLSENDRAIVDDLTYEMRRGGEDPLRLQKDPRFLGLSREARFVVTKRLGDAGVLAPDQTRTLLRQRTLLLRGKPGESLAVLKVGRNGDVTRVDAKFSKEKRSEELQIGGSTRTVEANAESATEIPVEAGDQIVIVPASAEEFRMGTTEREGVDAVLKAMQDLKDDPNRSAKKSSQRLSDASGRPHLVLKIPA